MGQEEDNLNTAIAHAVLCCVTARGLGHSAHSYTTPGVHTNFFIHGILGFFHHQSGIFNNDFKQAYTISYKATRCLALPCLMAQLYRGDAGLSSIHLISGLVPFALALAGEENVPLTNLVLACNVISLGYYSLQRGREWGWYTAGAAILAYFVIPTHSQKVLLYPLGLALFSFCAYRVCWSVDSSQGGPGP